MEALVVFLGILFAGIIFYFLFTDPLSFTLFGLLLGILAFVLIYFGFITFDTKTNELDITYRPTPVPSGGTSNGVPQPSRPVPAVEEVFYVGNNIFEYNQAPMVCKAYGAEVATYSQIEDAYSRGAEWCGYGWTQGGIALFPTQEETWRNLQLEVDPAKRIACGRPGINGGYFDPSTKFGVNCYGVRPDKKPGLDGDIAFAQSVDRFKGFLDKISVYPFNKGDWSEYSGVAKSIVSAEANIKGIGSELSKGTKTLEQSISSVGGDVAEGAVATGSGIINFAKSTVTSAVAGLGNLGSSIVKGAKRGVPQNVDTS
jgi:hypothetical protein